MPKRLSNEEFISKARAVHGHRFIYTEDTYINSYTAINVICRDHGPFTQVAGDHLRGFGCATCSGKRRLTTDQFVEKARKIHFDKYDYSKTRYISSNKEVCIVCPKHGEFWKKPTYHIYGTRNGCAKCCYSKGEMFVENWLIQNKIAFETQQKFDGCVNPLTNYRLRFDFFIPTRNMCIEVDGIQHQTEKHFLNTKVIHFTGTKERDRIKTNFCRKNGIELVRLQWNKKTETLEYTLTKLFT